jgi:hypothetical protein
VFAGAAASGGEGLSSARAAGAAAHDNAASRQNPAAALDLIRHELFERVLFERVLFERVMASPSWPTCIQAKRSATRPAVIVGTKFGAAVVRIRAPPQ